MNDKQFTDELFRRMYDLGYRKAERALQKKTNELILLSI